MERVTALEVEMEASGAVVFGGRLHDPDSSTVVRESDGALAMTEGVLLSRRSTSPGFTSSTLTTSMER